MDLVVGNEYYYLTEEQYTTLTNLAVTDEDFPTEGGLLNDFVKVGSYYYAELTAIDADEEDFLLINDLFNTTVYSKSTQPGGAV